MSNRVIEHAFDCQQQVDLVVGEAEQNHRPGRPVNDELGKRGGESDGDLLLGILVNMADRVGLSLGMTLNLGGILVSGELVGGKAYMDGIAAEFRKVKSTGTPGAAETMGGIFESAASAYDEQIKGLTEEEILRDRPRYIHLRNAKMFHPGGNPIPTGPGIWWRGRLASVGGFILGKLERP